MSSKSLPHFFLLAAVGVVACHHGPIDEGEEVVTSALQTTNNPGPGALGVVGIPSGGGLEQKIAVADGATLGAWKFSLLDDRIVAGLNGDVDNDGFDDFVIRNSSRMGVLGTNSKNALVSKAVATFPASIGEDWTLQASDQVIAVLRVAGSPRAHLLIKGAPGFALAEVSGGILQAVTVVPNGSVISGGGSVWQVTPGDEVIGVGRLNGSSDSVIVKNQNAGLGLWLFADTGAPKLQARLPNGTRWPVKGSPFWKLDTTDPRLHFLGANDINKASDKRAEMVLASKSGLAIFHFNGKSGTKGEPLDLYSLIPDGQAIPGTAVIGTLHALAAVRDFDKSGGADLLFQTQTGLSILSKTSSAKIPWSFKEVSKLAYDNSIVGGWNLDRSDRLLPLAADFDASGQNDFIITSTAKLGVLSRNAAVFKAVALNDYTSLPFRDPDCLWGVGRFERSGRSGLLFTACAPLQPTGPAVLTYAYNNQRTGVSNLETIITPDLLRTNGLTKRLDLPVNSAVTAQVLYAPNVKVKGVSQNLIIAAASLNSIYVWSDPADPTQDPVLLTPNNAPLTFDDPRDPALRSVRRGLLSTPAIDYENKLMYFVFSTNDVNGDNVAYYIAALDLQTLDGSYSTMRWKLIDGSFPPASFNPFHQFQRAALLVNRGSVYVAFGSQAFFEDHQGTEYHGWVFRYSTGTLEQLGMFNTSPNEGPNPRDGVAAGAGIWAGGGGLATDNAGNVYFMTGNGPGQAADLARGTFGDCFLWLAPRIDTLQLVDQFPTDDPQRTLEKNDWDLGGGGPVVIIGPNRIIGGGKDGKLYNLELGTFKQAPGTPPVQGFNTQYDVIWHSRVGWEGGPHLHGQPVFFGGFLYHHAELEYLRGFALTNGILSSTPAVSNDLTIQPFNALHNEMFMRGRVSASARGTTAGVIWSRLQAKKTSSSGCEPDPFSVEDPRLVAYDATPGTDGKLHCLASVQTTRPNTAPPTVVAGKVFLTGSDVATGQNFISIWIPGASPAPSGCNSEPTPAGNCMGLIFAGQEARGIDTGDWAPNSFKGECPASQAAQGLSVSSSSRGAHALFCGLAPSGLFHHDGASGCQALSLSGGSAECATNQFVAGVAQTPQGALSHILCCPHSITPGACTSLDLTQGEVVPPPPESNNFDWDPGADAAGARLFDRAECGSSSFLRGVTRDVATGAARALRCCANF